jgi:hypothetical protein
VVEPIGFWVRDGSIPLRFQGVSQLSCVQTKSKKKLRQFLCLLKIKELLAQFLDRGVCTIDKRSRSLPAQTGWLVNSNKIRCAMRISIRKLRDVLLTTPSAPLRNGTFLLRRRHPSLKTEGNELALSSRHRFRNCSPRAITRNPTFMRGYNHSLRNVWDRTEKDLALPSG